MRVTGPAATHELDVGEDHLAPLDGFCQCSGPCCGEKRDGKWWCICDECRGGCGDEHA